MDRVHRWLCESCREYRILTAPQRGGYILAPSVSMFDGQCEDCGCGGWIWFYDLGDEMEWI